MAKTSSDQRRCIAGYFCAIALAASSGSNIARAHDSDAHFEEAECPADVAASLQASAVEDVRCGFVQVPESYERSCEGDTQLRVFVMIAKTPSSEPRTPVFMLTGGPGQSLSLIAGQVFSVGAMARVREHRDVVLLDPRGSGFSEPLLRCDPGPPPMPGAEPPAPGALTPIQTQMLQCADALIADGVDLAAYNTANLARDVNRVRTALGIPRIALYGVSYGALLGLHTLRDADDWVESAVLVSLPRTRGGTVVRAGQSAQTALDNLAEACAESPACAAYGDFAANLDALLAKLSLAPLDLGRTSAGGVPLQLTVDFLGPAIQLALSEPQTAGQLPKAVAQALEGDGALWAPALEAFLTPPPFDPARVSSLPLHNSVWCSEELTIGSPEELIERAADTDAIVRRAFLGIGSAYEACEVWPVPPADADFYKPIKTRIPTYLIGGALDPITPPSFSQRALKHLKHGQLTVIEAASHLAAERGCGPELVARFFDAPYARVDDTCAAAPIPFVP